MGTWQTFDAIPAQYDPLNKVLKTMHASGARVIDTSPMYGKAEEAIGNISSVMPAENNFFYATKVWTEGAVAGRTQINNSYKLMKRQVMDLIQIHNLVDWQTHLPFLKKLKEDGLLRYIGITHYLDSSHDALAAVIKKEPIDFVQFNYSILSRQAAKTLLPLCQRKGIATLINRPFGVGTLFKKVAGKPLPPWALEAGIQSWSAYFLKAIIAHPAVTCVIPATRNPIHAAENFKAGFAPVPDAALLKKMIAFVEA